MRELLGWAIEALCRLADADVCAMANLTDDEAAAADASG